MTTGGKVVDNITPTRLVVYDFLRRVFLHEPTEEFFGRLSESELLEELQELPGVPQMLSALQEAQASGDVEPLRRDFFQLFLGPRRLKAPPWESVYVSENRLVNQESAAEVRQTYREFGFQTEDGQLEDHFGTECDFVFRLCAMTFNADEDERKRLLSAQRDFVNGHFARWVPRFAEDIRKNATTSYFQGMGEFLIYWIQSEQDYLASAE